MPDDGDDVAIKVSDPVVPGENFTLVLDLNAPQSVSEGNDGHWHMHGSLSRFFRRYPDDHHGHKGITCAN